MDTFPLLSVTVKVTVYRNTCVQGKPVGVGTQRVIQQESFDTLSTKADVVEQVPEAYICYF